MKKSITTFLTFLILWTFLVPVSAAHGSAPPPYAGRLDAQRSAAVAVKIAPALMSDLHSHTGEPLRVIVLMRRQTDLGKLNPKGMQPLSREERRRILVQNLTQTAYETQPRLVESLRSRNLLGKSINIHSYWIFNGFAMTADPQTIYALADSADVARIFPDEVIQIPISEFGTLPPDPVIPMPVLADDEPTPEGGTSAGTSTPQASATPLVNLSWGVEKIGAEKVWKELNITGEGVVVGTIDSGVSWEHPALKERYRGWNGESAEHQYSWFDAIGGKDAPYDDQGHGTHTMGSFVGYVKDGAQTGVAPGAKWIAVKALDSHGSGLASDLLKAMEWMLAPGGNPDFAPDVVSNSWGARGCEDTFKTAVDAWIAAGIVPVFSNGNNGAMGEETVGSPACYEETIGVGATDREDRVAEFSSQGPGPQGIIKPDLSAPGVRVRSSMNNGGYGEKSGTSMATPYVAGVAALLLSAKADLDLAAIKNILRETAQDIGAPGGDNQSGWGRVDAYRAVKSVLEGSAGPSTTPASATPAATQSLVNPPLTDPAVTKPAVTKPAVPEATASPTMLPQPTQTGSALPPDTPAPTMSVTPSPQISPLPTDGGPDMQPGMTLEDTSPEIRYDDSWQRIENKNFSNGSQHISKTIGASFELRFSGRRIALVSTRAPSYGVMYVMIDGAYVGYINLYAGSIQWQQKWTSRVLPEGEHSLKIVHYSGDTVNLDAVVLFEGN